MVSALNQCGAAIFPLFASGFNAEVKAKAPQSEMELTTQEIKTDSFVFDHLQFATFST